MGFKANKVEIGNIPKWMVEKKSSPSLTWERHDELLEEHTQKLAKEIEELKEEILKIDLQSSQSQKNLKDKIRFLEDKDNNSLSEQELMFLLHFIKEASFKGAQLEYVFQVTLKLQNQYQFIEKNQKKVD
jgi:DNA-binding transcriptional MerR regulator